MLLCFARGSFNFIHLFFLVQFPFVVNAQYTTHNKLNGVIIIIFNVKSKIASTHTSTEKHSSKPFTTEPILNLFSRLFLRVWFYKNLQHNSWVEFRLKQDHCGDTKWVFLVFFSFLSSFSLLYVLSSSTSFIKIYIQRTKKEWMNSKTWFFR